MDINEIMLQWLINSLIKKAFGGAVTNENLSNQELNELQKPIIRKFEIQKVYSSFIANI